MTLRKPPGGARGGGKGRPSKKRAGARPSGARRIASRRAPEPAPEPLPAGMVRLFLATKNPGKARELADLVADLPLHVVGPEAIAAFGNPVEDGATFEANARKKALYYSQQGAIDPDTLVMVDDSGLEVDALDGQPGVRSARLGGPHASDADRVRLILNRLEGIAWEKRTARFRCVVAIAQKHRGVLATFEGTVEGRIAFQPAGAEGFGYDPIFYYLPAEMTFAEMTAVEKNRVSHRGQALERAVGWLKEWVSVNLPLAGR